MNAKMKGGEVRQWEGDPEVHEIMLTGITRALASFGPWPLASRRESRRLRSTP